MEGTFRLVGGQTDREGDVQICHHGVWGYVCGCEWDHKETSIACQQLNYSNTGETANNSFLHIKLVTPIILIPLLHISYMFDFLQCIHTANIHSSVEEKKISVHP